MPSLHMTHEDGLAPQLNPTFPSWCINFAESTPCNVQDVMSWISETLQLPADALPARVNFMVTVSFDAHPLFPCYSEETRQSTDWAFVAVPDIPTRTFQFAGLPSCEKPVPVVQERVVVNMVQVFS